MGESRSIPGPEPEPRCWDCGASNDPGSSECWLCQRRDWNRYPGPRGLRVPPGRPRDRSPSSIAGLMTGIAIIAVTFGLYREAPGVAIAAAIAVGPALLLTELKARKRWRRGEPMSAVERILRVIALTIVIPILLIVALVITVFAICYFGSGR